MNSASFLLCLVFAGIGYVMYPMIIPKLVDAKLVSESAMSDGSDKGVVDDEDSTLAIAGGDAEVVERPSAPEVAVAPAMTPAVVEVPVEKVEPVMPEVVEMAEPAAPVVTEETPEAPVPVVADKLTDAEFINALKGSVKAGDVSEFNFAAVVDWKRMDEQSIDGGIYEVGMATYNASTIFGEQQLQAKALVKDGKVVKWLWPETNTEMR